MIQYRRLLVLLLVALAPLACTTTQTGQPSGARPQIIYDDIGGIWQPAMGIDRNARPDIPDGQRYLASGPYTVNFRAIPANERRPTDLTGIEYLRGGGRIESQLPDEAMARLRAEARFLRASPLVQDPTANASLAPDQAAASKVTGFDSIDLRHCCGGGGSVPPDPELAAGPNHVIAVVNVALEIYDTSGHSQGGPTTLSSFFANDPKCTGQFDPNAIYDESADRFIIGADGDGSDYCIAVSQTSDPTGDWYLYSFQTASRRDFFDYPHAGVGEDAIYLGANMFGVLQFKEGRVWAINKADLYAGRSPQVVSYGLGSDGTPQPMNLHGWNQGTWPSDGVHYILTDGRVYDGRNIGVWSWRNPFSGGVPTKEGEVDLVAASGVSVGMPVDAPQQGGDDLQANDWRVQDAEYRGGYIWTSNAQSCNPGGGTVNCVRWAQIDPTGPSVIAAEVVGTPGQYLSFPDLAVDHCGNMMMGYSKTSPTMNPGIYATARDNTGVAAELTVKAAEAVYDAFDSAPHRWGDYTGMTIAPDGSTFWYLGEYSKNDNFIHGNWGTWINSFSFGCNGGGTVNKLPTAVIDTPSCTLLACDFVGSNSSDSDGTIDSYAWDFGDDSGSNVADPPTHTYGAKGTYNVSLTVTDDDGATDTANVSVIVDDGINIAPTAVITLINCSNATRTCTYNGNGSSDSDGSISSYAWDFGDNTPNGGGVTTSHTYAGYGDYLVSLTVTDNEGADSTNDASETVTLTEPVDATTMHVASVFVDTANASGGSKAPRATVVIEDDQGSPVGAVDVYGVFTGDANGSDSSSTDGSGTAVLVSPNSKKGKVKFEFCVSDVSGSETLQWDGIPVCASN